MQQLQPCEICNNKSIGEVHEYEEGTGRPISHSFCIKHLTEGVNKYQHTFKYNTW